MSLIDDKWRILFDKYRIEREIEKHGRFYITADQIREVKEPRLMTKFDTRESLPRVFGKKISILPVSRGGYVLGTKDSPSAANADPDMTAPEGYVYVPVKIGVSDDDYTQIISGVTGNDAVAYDPSSVSTDDYYDDGSSVMIF